MTNPTPESTTPPPSTGPTTQSLEAISSILAAARDRLHTPEDLGRAVVDYVLTEAVSKGTFNATGQIEVPLTAVVTLPTSDDEGHTKLCITAFGHELLCLEAHVSSH